MNRILDKILHAAPIQREPKNLGRSLFAEYANYYTEIHTFKRTGRNSLLRSKSYVITDRLPRLLFSSFAGRDLRFTSREYNGDLPREYVPMRINVEYS